MAKASLTLPTGTVVTIEGTPKEVQQILALHTSPPSTGLVSKPPRHSSPKPLTDGEPDVPLEEIVSHIKSCKEAEQIERTILDKPSQLERTLLPLYILHVYMEDRVGLSSGDISKITRELGVMITQPHASTMLASHASKYVVGDKIRKDGIKVRYKLNRRGVQHMKSVLNSGTPQASTN
jgi:hypothetical protein